MSRLGKICVILGAGASFDVRSSGSPIIWPSGLGGDAFNGEYKPPLAKSIFDMGHRVYYPILNRYPGAIVVANDISRAVSMEQISLEEALAGIAFHTDPKFRLHYKHVPPYIRDLIFTCTYHYTPYPSNYIRLVSELLSYSPHEVCFLVLNYDDLLEQALRHHTPREYSFENIQDYVALDRGAKVVKLHGSVNWFRTLRQATRGDRDDWFRFLEEFDPLKPPGDETEYRIQDGVTEVLKSPDMLYPILTAPLAGEDPKQFTCPPSHIEVARQFLHDCTKFLIIGTAASRLKSWRASSAR